MNDTFLEFCGSVFISLLVWFFGIPDGFFKLLIALSVIDYLSGTFLAWRFHKLSSRIGFEGILRKCLMFTFVGIANLLDSYIGEALGTGAITRIVVSCFYISNEGISIIENADAIGIPIPQILREKFIELKDKQQHNLSDHNNSDTEKISSK
jgi:toxin secretion/phage lysis holin